MLGIDLLKPPNTLKGNGRDRRYQKDLDRFPTASASFQIVCVDFDGNGPHDELNRQHYAQRILSAN